MAKRTTKQTTPTSEAEQQPQAKPGESTSSSLISSIYARRYGATAADAGVGVKPPSDAPKGDGDRRK